MKAPTKPSTVFFGLSLMRGVRPNALPGISLPSPRTDLAELTADICHDIVADDQRSRHEEPDEALEDVVDDEVARNDDEQQADVDPAEQGELLAEVLLLEVANETNETDDVEHEADETVVAGERDEVRVDKDDVLEVVDDGFAVEEVVADDEEVPVQRLAPSVTFCSLLGAG